MSIRAWTDPASAPGAAAARPGASIRRPVGGAAPILELQRAAGNRAVSRALHHATTAQREPDDKARPADPKHVTGYLGLNPGARKEARALKQGSRQEILTSINDGDAEKRFADNPGILDFIFTELGYSVGDVRGWMGASAVLFQADPPLRDQLADLMRWMHRAELGQIVLERLVMSGHSNGVALWGDSAPGMKGSPGKMLIERDLGNLARAFPKAAGQVEDIMFSACFSLNAVEIVRRAFPNLKSVWSYGGWSPEIDQGSQEHIQGWSRATEGARTPTKGSARGSTALWTRDKGYLVGDPNAADAGLLYSECQTLWTTIAEPMFLGTGDDVPEGRLLPLYAKLQALRVNAHADGMAKGFAEMQIGKVLRMRKWTTRIRERFGREYGPKLQPMYDAIGVKAPDWRSLTRKQLVAHMDAVEKALGKTTDPKISQPYDDYLKAGLFGFDESIIKDEWI
jgi:hypothetical protein